MPKVFVCRSIPESGLQLLRDALGEEALIVASQDGPIARKALLQDIAGADALLPILTDRIDAAVMDAAGERLKIIANYAVGFNNIDVAAATARGIVVTNTPGVLSETTADTAWLLLMMAARRGGEAERYVREGRWHSWSPTLLLGRDVHHATLGIFGMGRIGQAVAQRARAFSMHILYTNRTPLPNAVEESLGATYVDKDTLLAQSDFLSIHCPLTPKTHHAFGVAEFVAMKKDAILINTARGSVVDEAALADALQQRQITAAGLDVFEEEPTIHPALLQCENAVLFPHLGSASWETRSQMAEIAAKNIIACLQGETPPNCVNPEVL